MKPVKRNGGAWTEGRYRTFIVSALRSGLRRWPPKYTVLKNAATERKLNPKSGKLAMHYKCARCEEQFPLKDVEVDHIKPVVDPKKGFVSWDVFIDRLYCEITNLQVLCKPCHKSKSAKERVKREQKKIQDAKR